MELVKNILIISITFTIVSMLIVKFANFLNERSLKAKLCKVLPALVDKEDYDMIVIEINRAFANGLSQSSKNKIMWYVELIMSMRIDYSEEKLVNVIKKS